MRATFFTAVLLCAASGASAQVADSRNPHGDLKLECRTCHVSEGWAVVRPAEGFRHAPRTFPLAGAHATATCRACHVSLDFRGARTACATCHRDIHNGELGVDCARCHAARSFIDRAPMLRQHQQTRFALTGTHAAADCEACHRPAAQGHLQFVNTPTRCQDCHLASFQAAQAPDHVNGGFPQDCTQCHGATLWVPARFNHDRIGFPLTGAHRAIACSQCHPGSAFSGRPTACVGCHLQDYQATTNPNHAASQFPQDCVSCHSTTSWDGAAFDHSRSGFPLTGRHQGTPCADCHRNNQYTGLPTDCLSCHRADYDATTDPSHVAAGFPTDCISCHSTAGWAGAAFDHDGRFSPIYSGAHRGKWAGCTTCHTSSTNYGQFTCFNCHEHDQARMDSKHQGRSGYRYDSQACYSCHPRGNH